MSGAAFKDEGNTLFKSGEFLKAAAAYTKAIKAEPDNHVYYSNRSNAFLKLSKVSKALEDAEKCVSLAPDFVKGYHRKASALHAAERTDEAAEVLLFAIEKGLDNNELVRMGIQIKGKSFVQLAAARRPGGDPSLEPAKPAGKENGAPAPKAGAGEKAQKISSKEKPAGAAPPQQAGTHLYQLDPESFAGLIIKDVFSEVLEKKTVPTICYLQPGPPAVGQKDEPGLSAVGIEHAFASPQTLTNCAEFLTKHIGETRSQSAMIVVRKGHVQYPCVWKGDKSKWPCDKKKDGILMQLEARGARALFFTEITGAKGNGYQVGETHQIDAEEFALFPRLFK
jgi:hypothetical protein